METTRVWNQRLNPVAGDSFVTNRRHPVLTVVEDTTPGVHDTFMAACDRKRYQLLGVSGYHRNCCDNMFELGVTPRRANLASFNIFMNIRVQADGITLPTVTKPGEYITLRAEMDCFVAFSACPQDIVKIQGQDGNTPKPVEIAVLDGFAPDVRGTQSWVPNA
ncbi:hypothetical protein R69927_07173 [Paraburkholderia domus]|nr:hypothetical protein R69927_07173 [Paraburkholderia domus]